eukprot:Rmarinus@m.14910
MAWEEYYNPEGIPYFVNENGDMSWDKPDELKSADERSKEAGSWVWLRDAKEGFKAARRVEGDEEVETVDGQRVKLNSVEIYEPLEYADLRRISDDLVQMNSVNDAMILHNLRERFKNNRIYTNVGSILISVNPYQRLPIYTPAKIKEYWEGHRGLRDLPPHLYAVAGSAFRSLLEDRVSNSILISGESGAGKTEATKLCLQYFAQVAGTTEGIEQTILQASPLLEAFGNAKTLRNDNSSRFGKWVEVHFDPRNCICGAKTVNYLLEKSRIAVTPKGERNFHIFYQLLRGATDEMRKDLGLLPPEQFKFLNGGEQAEIAGVDDRVEFENTMNAMHAMEFTPTEMQEVIRIVSAILFLGNLEFEEDVSDATADAGSKVSNPKVLQHAAMLLSVGVDALQAAIVSKQIVGATYARLKPEQASEARGSLCRNLYAKVFDYIVQRANDVASPEPALREYAAAHDMVDAESRVIGILDIFGFEIFTHNSFEQLCINYANEKLQQHFNQHTFRLEEEMYKSEAIQFTPVEYIDNKPVLDLVESVKPPGIFGLIDEEIKLPAGSDDSLYGKLILSGGYTGTHAKFSVPIAKERGQLQIFIVKHYAGDVTYDITDTLAKNKDQLSDDLVGLFSVSKLGVVQGLMGNQSARGSVSIMAAKSSRGRKMTQAAQFSKQLAFLMQTLEKTNPHYIRCVKPNAFKKSNTFDPLLCYQQLRYSGVFEAVLIRKSGFPFKYTHKHFYHRFRCLAPEADSLPDDRVRCDRIIEHVRSDAANRNKETTVSGYEVQVGNTRVLYRALFHRQVELLRAVEVTKRAIRLQSQFRGFLARKRLRLLRETRKTLTDSCNNKDFDLLKEGLEKSKVEHVSFVLGLRLLFTLFLTDREEIMKMHAKLAAERALRDEMDSLLTTKSGKDAAEANKSTFESCVHRAREMETILGRLLPQAEELVKLIALVDRRRDVRNALESGVKQHAETTLLQSIEDAKELEFGTGPGKISTLEKKLLWAAQDEVAKHEKCRKDLKSAATSLSESGLSKALETARTLLFDETLECVVTATEQLARFSTCRAHLKDGVAKHDRSVLENAVAEAASLKLSSPEDKELLSAAEKEINRLKEGEKLIPILEEALASGGAVRNGDEWDASGVVTSSLEAAIAKAEAFGLDSPQGLLLVKQAKATLTVRNAFKIEDWDAIEEVCLSVEHDGLSSSELDDARSACARKRSRDKVVALLESSATSKDRATLRVALEQAEALGLTDDSTEALSKAREVYTWTQEADTRVKTAMDDVEESDLQAALAYCEENNYISSTVTAGKELLDKIRSLCDEISKAIEDKSEAVLESLLQRAEEIHLPTTHDRISEARECILWMEDAKQRLRDAITSVDDDLLEMSINHASSNNYSCESRTKAEDLLTRIKSLYDELAKSTADKDEENLLRALADAKSIQVSSDKPAVVAAEECRTWIEDAKRMLTIALAEMDEQLMRHAIKHCDDHGYKTDAVENVRATHEKVVTIITEMKASLDVLEPELMEAALAKAEQINLVTEETKLLVKFLRETTEKAFVTMQKDRAEELGDKKRVANLLVRLKNIDLEEHGHLYAMIDFEDLRDPDEWAKMKKTVFSSRDKIRSNKMLLWSNKPIHATLTKLANPDDVTLALDLFRNIMGIMGDIKLEYVDQLENELLSKCEARASIRDEVYIQLMKQLNANPNEISTGRGWALLKRCLDRFAPGERCGTFVAAYLKNKDHPELVETLHHTMYLKQAQ